MRCIMSLTDECLVLYCDGGCLQTAEIGGWGIHGYFYKPDVPKQGAGCPKGIPTAIGYCSKETNNGVTGSPVTMIRYIDGFGSMLSDTTNNIAELTAAINALNYILEKKPKKVNILTDSKYVVSGLNEWSVSWIRNDWTKPDGSSVLNKEYWVTIIALRDKVVEMGIEFTIDWVRGHVGDIGNETADRLATYGVILAKKKHPHNEMRETEAKGYWGKDFTYNRIVDKSRWYFNTHHPKVYNEDLTRKPNGQWVYHLGNHGPDDELIGKPISDSSFSVVYLNKPIHELQMIRSYQNQISCSNYENVVVGRLDNILSGNSLEILNEYNTLLLEKLEFQNNVVLNKNLLTIEMNPPQLAYRSAEYLNHLEWILDCFLDDPAKYGLVITEITDIFYSTETKSKKECTKLKPSMVSAVKKVDVKIKYDTNAHAGEIDVPLVFGIDCPTRNALAALAEQQPQFYAVTWRESDTAFHYATILKTKEDIGIWAGVYSNLRLIQP